MQVHLVDATYELFRHHFGAPRRLSPQGQEVGATVGLMFSLMYLLSESDVTHVGCAFDHEIRSFRNQIYAGYKTEEGVEPDLLAQFPLAEEAVESLGIVVWPGVEFEADDLMASAAAKWIDHPQVERIVLCSPDKDLAQCVKGTRVVCLDRRRRKVLDEIGVEEKFGVGPASIPDLLALMGDSADGIPGIPRWGAKSASTLLARFKHLEEIPSDPGVWGVKVRGAEALADSLNQRREEAALFKYLTTLRLDAPIPESLEDLKWRGARRRETEQMCQRLGLDDLIERIPQWI